LVENAVSKIAMSKQNICHRTGLVRCLSSFNMFCFYSTITTVFWDRESLVFLCYIFGRRTPKSN